MSSDCALEGQDHKDGFPNFQRLPLELRVRIWGLCAEPRIVHIETITTGSIMTNTKEIMFIKSSSTCPVMQACAEARHHAPYRKAFTIGIRPRYTWVNFNLDRIAIGDGELDNPALRSHQLDIEHLQFTVGEQDYDWIYWHGHEELSPLLALRSIHVCISHELRVWATAFEYRDWGSCPKDNIRIIDMGSGQVLTVEELSALDEWLIQDSCEG